MIDTPFTLRVMRVRPHNLPPPSRAHETDAGLDLSLDLLAMSTEIDFYTLTRGFRRNVEFRHITRGVSGGWRLELPPGARVNLPVGWAVEIPPGWEGCVRGRSGGAFDRAVTVGHVGTIDAGFRGEIRVCLVNANSDSVFLQHGERIAQLVITRIPTRIIVDEVPQLSDAPRGTKGYGSTGR